MFTTPTDLQWDGHPVGHHGKFVCRVVEFKDEDFVKKAIEVMNKYDLSGRPLNIKEVCSC